ncbi:odorant receptor 98a-like [Drosophila pseudoobscura]|uniref:Odorant receptor n=1 Tax=Drosophila pseudoobscura pseudoobscura TaxID=46245 RepID=A0A6I8V4A1_DROPS|nr:odorant receptor 98a [Drosophila pseudoobscura]
MLINLLKEPLPWNLMSSPEAFKYLEYAMILMGWTPPQEGWKPFRIILTIVISFWWILYVPIGVFITFFVELKTLSPSEALSVLQVGINAGGFPLKMIIMRLNMWRYHKIKELLGRMDKRCINITERLEVHRWVARCNIVYLIYQFMYTAYTLSTFFTAIFSGVLPFRLYNPFIDWRESTMNLWIASVLELIPMNGIVSQTYMMDVFPLLYGLILRCHVKLLRQRIENLCSDPRKSDDENNEDLVFCIKDHKLILEYVSVMRPVIETIIFVQFLLIGLLLGITMLNLFFFADFWAKLAIAAYINGLIIQTFPFCFTCDLLKDDCESLAFAIFHSHWKSSSRRYKSSLIYFLHNAQMPISFTAGSIFPIGLKTNITVAKLAFSVVTFVQQLNIADKLRKE